MSFEVIYQKSSNLIVTVREEEDGNILTTYRFPVAQEIWNLWENSDEETPFPESVIGVSNADLAGIKNHLSGVVPFPLHFTDRPNKTEVDTLKAVLIAFAKDSMKKSHIILSKEQS